MVVFLYLKQEGQNEKMDANGSDIVILQYFYCKGRRDALAGSQPI